MSTFGDIFAASIVPKSDQINADDLVAGPRIVTIREMRETTEEQPIWLLLENENRAFRPCKTMRKLIAALWGKPESKTAWAGRQLELYRDPTAKWAGVAVGGVRIGGMSHIKREETIMLQISQKNKQPFTVRPLPTVSNQRQPDRAPESTKPAADWRDEMVTAASKYRLTEADLSAVADGRPRAEWTPGDVAAMKARINRAYNDSKNAGAGETGGAS